MTKNQNLRTAALSLAAGGALTVLGLLFGPAGSAGAAEVDVQLDATTGSVTLPTRTATTNVPVLGYCLRTDPGTACGTVSAPGGPTISVDEGDVVTITLHNQLSEATSLFIGGQPMVPDPTGAAAGADVTYSFTASSPGTFLYEAGLTSNQEHQVAMGLYGAFVVRPATGGQAYDDAATAYDTESVQVLSEVDPVLNRTADPAAFDMRNFTPRWTLVNGKVHPATDPIAAASGQKVLVRWINAGLFYRSMAVLGAGQDFVAVDGHRLANGTTDLARTYVAETMGPGQTADAIVTAPTTTADRRLPVYDASLALHNTNAAGSGGMLTFLEVTGVGSEPDASGPATTGVDLATSGDLTANVSDAATGGAAIQAAEYYLDSIAGTPMPLGATDGAFDSASEGVTLSGVSVVSGQHVLYVRGQDAVGNWGPFSSVLVMGADDRGPTTTGVTLTPDRTNGTADVTVDATGNDSASGNSDITAADLSVDGVTASAMSIATSGPVAAVQGTIAATDLSGLAEGNHVVSVRTQDAAGNWSEPADAALVIDRTGPVASDVSVTPNPNNGTMPVNGSSPAVRLSATIADPASGDAGSTFGTAQSTIAKAEAFLDETPGAPGSGLPLEAADGAFSSASENVYLDIPLTTVRQLPDGPHTLAVRGRDAAGNWGDVVSTTLVVDKTGPAVIDLTVVPNPAVAVPSVTVTATVLDAMSTVASVEYFIGADPGVGNGIPVTRAPDGSVSFTADITGVAEGNRTLTVRALDSLGNRGSAAQVVNVQRPLWFTTVGNGRPPGITGAVDDSDVYLWAVSAFTRVFDMSTAPYSVPGSADVDGFSRVDANHFYASFAGNTTLAGVGTVRDEDVVYWNGGSGWQMFFDGSSHGITGGAAFGIDAINVDTGTLYFSTDSNTNPPGVTGQPDNSDIYRWDGGNGYTRVIDATTIGIPNGANVDGFVRAGADDWLFSFSNTSVSVSGLGTVADEDVVRRVDGSWSTYFDGSAHGLTANNQDIDAIDIP